MLIPFDNKYLNENFNNIDTSKNNLLAICQFKNGLREGKAHFYIKNVFMNKEYNYEKIMNKEYNYEKTGTKINYDFNFKNDLLNGPSQIYTKIFEADTNYIRTDNYKDGYLHGDSKTYFEDGKVSLEANFQNGILSGNLNTYFNSN
jgi:antitoxin component YwqK of YwqJK toxin-antitoxin module